MYKQAVFCIALIFAVGLSVDVVAAQPLSFEAVLMNTVESEPVRKGTALVSLNGNEMRILGTLYGLTSPWIQADIYSGDPDDGGSSILNLAILVSDPNALAGGFDRTVTLTEEQAEALQDTLLYVLITAQSSDPENRLKGRIEAIDLAEWPPMATGLSHFFNGHPSARGSVYAIPGPTTLRLVGYANGLASNWQQIAITKGPYGGPSEHVATILAFPDGGLYVGFEHTLDLGDGWQDAFWAGQFHIEVMTSRPTDRLHGRLLALDNQAPPASAVLSPASGETILAGGTGGADPADPSWLLGTITLQPVEDPDDQPVAYFLQIGDRDDLSGSHKTLTSNLGVDQTTFPLSVAGAAEIFDGFLEESGSIPLDTMRTFYVRGVTTDGSRYTVGDPIQISIVRGLITSTESASETPDVFRLHGNYPNPFNPSTTILFDLEISASISVEIYDVVGRQVMLLDVGSMPAGNVQRVDLDAGGLTSGMYLYRVVAATKKGTTFVVGRMTVLK